MSFANNTRIKTPNGTEKVASLSIGTTALIWTPNGTEAKTVSFSDGTDDGSEMTMILIRFGEESLIVTHNQPIMLSDQTVVKASDLYPGRDAILAEDGHAIHDYQLHSGRFRGGCYSIAFSQDVSKGCFIIANGIICGDFNVELTHG